VGGRAGGAGRGVAGGGDDGLELELELELVGRAGGDRFGWRVEFLVLPRYIRTL